MGTSFSILLYLILILLSVSRTSTIAMAKRQKRQLFREHLLPQYGGKIPEEAFDPARLILNKYNQNGFFIPNGYHLVQNHVESHHSPRRSQPDTLQILVPEDVTYGYVAPPGRFNARHLVDTTYLMHPPVAHFDFCPPVHHYPFLPFVPYDSLIISEKFNNHQSDFYNTNEIHPQEIFNQLAPDLRPLFQDE